jgi:hypothetical protein
MALNLCIFEDEHFNWLYPLSLTRPVFDLRCGISLLRADQSSIHNKW